MIVITHGDNLAYIESQEIVYPTIACSGKHDTEIDSKTEVW
jgi:hypothetical protein